MHDTQHDVMMRLNVLERRVAALESGATGKESLTVEPSVEDAAIARVRERQADVFGCLRVTREERSHFLAALDRARAERAGAILCVGCDKDFPTWKERRQHVLQCDKHPLSVALREREKERDDARTEAAALRAKLAKAQSWSDAMDCKVRDVTHDYVTLAERSNARIAELEAQLAARTDAKPLGWVNVYPDELHIFMDEDEASDVASLDEDVVRVAVPVYEHPPVAPLVTGTFTDAEIEEAIRTGWANFGLDGNQNALVDEMQSALRPLFDRAARGPVVGACVVRDGSTFTWPDAYGTQKSCEHYATEYVKTHGGTAHRLHLGDVIGGAA